MMSNSNAYKWTSTGITHVGMVRQLNEDQVLDMPEIGLWVVADGMGGHEAGEVASNMIVDRLKTLTSSERVSDSVNQVEDILLEVNDTLIEMATKDGEEKTIGSTVVALIAHKNHCVCIWAGDSRAYRFRDGMLKQISQDHSHVEELIEQGVIDRSEAATHPAANVITRAVGAHDVLYLDVEIQEIVAGDRYLLSSDGLDKEVTEEEMAKHLAEGDTNEACNNLINLTLERGSRDNVTVIVIDFEKNEASA